MPRLLDPNDPDNYFIVLEQSHRLLIAVDATLFEVFRWTKSSLGWKVDVRVVKTSDMDRIIESDWKPVPITLYPYPGSRG